jgi:hypothetical protein
LFFQSSHFFGRNLFSYLKKRNCLDIGFFSSLFLPARGQKREKKTEFGVQKTTNSVKKSIKKKLRESKFCHDLVTHRILPYASRWQRGGKIKSRAKEIIS